MPPADSTEGCAAHGPISTARKGVWGWRMKCAWVRKARSLSTRLGPARHWAPAGGKFPKALWSTDLFDDVKETKWVLGPLLVHVLGSRKFCLQGKWKGLIAKQRAGPLFRQTEGVQ